MSDEYQFTCDWCGKAFDPNPDAVCEAGWSIEEMLDAADEWKGEVEVAKDGIPADQVTPEMIGFAKAHCGLSTAQAKELLTTGKVGGMTSIVCPKCLGDNSSIELT
jgi:hypothetical protein